MSVGDCFRQLRAGHADLSFYGVVLGNRVHRQAERRVLQLQRLLHLVTGQFRASELAVSGDEVQREMGQWVESAVDGYVDELEPKGGSSL